MCMSLPTKSLDRKIHSRHQINRWPLSKAKTVSRINAHNIFGAWRLKPFLYISVPPESIAKAVGKLETIMEHPAKVH